MTTFQPHRKRVRHFDLAGHCHELTFSCYHRGSLLTDDSLREQLAHAIDAANERHGWRLAAFVFMPEHVHVLVHPTENPSTISKLLFAIKRPFSFRVRQTLEREDSPLLNELTIRQRPSVSSFRFWQEGPGYDRNLNTEKAVLAAIDYLHMNPVRRGLCRRAADWRWSSARWYETDGQAVDPGLPKLTSLPGGLFHFGADG